MTHEESVEASAVFSRLTEGLTPCASLVKRAELDSEVHALQAAVMSIDPVRDTQLLEPIRQRLDAAKDAREKLNKKTPTTAALASALKEAKSSYERSIQDRLDRLAVGVAKAEERKKERRALLQRARDQMTTLEALLDAKEAQVAAAYQAMNATQASLESAVLDLFDTKLRMQQSDVSMEPAATTHSATLQE